ncbi:MAG: CAMP phosphodiesterase class-II:metallo-beta-lactamase-like protein [Dehalococcoidia bacterium]|nr:CAMP phosphodiesterase class-II:metallo-beta-lactamase-like protein [Dehalococcoidia bacterium]
MEIKVLGTRQGESSNSHFVSLLVDDVIALDAGNLTSALSLKEQSVVRHILVTHRHYDHIKDLATFGFNSLGRGRTKIYCSSETREAIETTIFNTDIWLNFFTLPNPVSPTFIHVSVEPGSPFIIEGYNILPLRVIHSVPALAYAITSPNGGTLLYSGDSGVGSGSAWAATKPDVLVVEITFPDTLVDSALSFGHLTPELLAGELNTFRDVQGYLPKIAAVHINPYYENEIVAGVANIARRLSVDISIPQEGAIITVGAESKANRRTRIDVIG